MPLSTGAYRITTFDKQFDVGRRRVEDYSIRPKEIVLLNPDEGGPSEPWIVQQEDAGYTLRARGGATAVIDNQVYAVLMDAPEPEQWKIEEVGEGLYTIGAQGKYWTYSPSAENLTQIGIGSEPGKFRVGPYQEDD